MRAHRIGHKHQGTGGRTASPLSVEQGGLKGCMGVPLIGVLLAGIVLTGVVGGPGATADEQQARTELVRMAIVSDGGNLTPFTGGFEVDLLNLVYDTLLYPTYDEQARPWLAQDIEISDDQKVWTVTVRSGVEWHDGEPFTAEDVVFTYDYLVEHEQGLYSHHIYDVPEIMNVEALDSETVQFTCAHECPNFDISTAALIPIIPEHIWSEIDEPMTYTEELPIGTGPYQLTDFDTTSHYVFEAKEGYFMGTPLVERIEAPIVEDASAMFMALAAGDVDTVAREIPPEVIPQLQESGGEVVRTPQMANVQININTQREPLDEPRLRRAMLLGVDTVEITELLLQDEANPGTEAILDPDSPFADQSLAEPVHDPEGAEQILEDLGFNELTDDGIRVNDEGTELRFEIMVESTEPQQVRASELTARQLSELGIEIDVNPLDPETLNERRQPPDLAEGAKSLTTQETGDYDMYISSYGAHFNFDPDGLLYLFHCPGETGFSAYIAGYCNERFDELVTDAITLDRDQRGELLNEAQQLLAQEAPFIPLYYPGGTYGYMPDNYNAWVPVPAHGIMNKLSFLPDDASRFERVNALEKEGTSEAAERMPDESVSWWPVAAVVLVAGAVVVVVAFAFLRGRQKRGGQEEEAW